jgi:hypothetical protein
MWIGIENRDMYTAMQSSGSEHNVRMGQNKSSFFSRHTLQTKLKINEPGDSYEREADAMADHVMRMSDSSMSSTFFKPAGNGIQRKCQECEEEDKHIHRKENSGGEVQSSNGLDSYINSLGSSGQPLPESSRRFFEPHFGRDFSEVRIHHDAVAAKSAQSINALAYTTGNNIVFNQGQYSPDSDSGKKLMAHELTHVMQQKPAGTNLIQRYETPEHQDVGDKDLVELNEFLKTKAGKKWASKYGYDPKQLVAGIEADPFFRGAKVHGLNMDLSWGEAMSMMGDYFGTWQSLHDAPKSKFRGSYKTQQGPNGEQTTFEPGLLDLADRERKKTIDDASATLGNEDITKGGYLKLAAQNKTHFAPFNRLEYSRMHAEALKYISDNPHQDSVLQTALFIDAAAGHFLSDAFASGHLFNYDKLMAAIQLYLSQHMVKAHIPAMQTFIEFAIISQKVGLIILKIIHDHFNTAGYEVSNPKTMTWYTYGDGHLDLAPDTRHIAALAVFLSRKQLYDTYQDNKRNPVDQTKLLQEITGLMPNDDTIDKVTDKAIAYIPTAAADVDSFMLAQKNAAESQFGPIGGPFVRYMLQQIDTNAHPGAVLPGMTTPPADILRPPLSAGLNLRPDYYEPGRDKVSLDVVVGQPSGYEGKRAWQFAVGLTYEF